MSTSTSTSTPIISTEILRDAGGFVATGVRFTFSNGEAFQVYSHELTPELMAEACAHGLKQKIGDAAAIARNQETGKSATVADKFAACEAIRVRLTIDKMWNAPRAEGAGNGGLLLRALVQHTGKTADAIKAYLETLSDEQKAALRKNPKVAAIIATLRPEVKPDASIDTDALLSSIMTDEEIDAAETGVIPR